MNKEMNNEYMEMLRKNKHLEKELLKKEKQLKRYKIRSIILKNKLVNEYKYINNLTKITGLECIDEYTTIMINKLKRK